VKQSLGLQKEEANEFVSSFREQTFAQNSLIRRVSSAPGHGQNLWVQRGLLHVYYYDERGRAHSLNFTAEQEWLISVWEELPPTYLIAVQALEKSTVFLANRQVAWESSKMAAKLEQLYRRELHKMYVQHQNRFLERNMSNAEQRYIAFRSRFAHLESRLSDAVLAAHLYIKPCELAELRRNWNQ